MHTQNLFWLIALLVLPAWSNSTSTLTATDIDHLASQLLEASGLPLRGEVRVDPVASSGMAAVQWRGDYGIIYVHPEPLRRLDRNTWAFIIGHELSHRLAFQVPPGPRQEQEADRLGAEMAVRAGYDVNAYVRWMYSQRGECSPMHGCMEDRARLLAQRYDVSDSRAHRSRPDHRRRASSGRESHERERSRERARAVPCQHAVPCVHRVPCQHIVITPWGQRQMHSFDQMHTHDTQHRHDVVSY